MGRRRRQARARSPANDSLSDAGRVLFKKLLKPEGDSYTPQMVQGSVWEFARDPTGSRAVQRALEVGSASVATEIVKELHGNVLKSVQSPHANHVIQKVIEFMPRCRFQFIAEELEGVGANIARHVYGCRIICRLLEHGGYEMSLVAEILNEVDELCGHRYGSHVLSSVLEHGSVDQRREIIRSLRKNLGRQIAQRHFCKLLEDAVVYCAASDMQLIVADLLASPSGLALLSQSQHGRYVIDVVRLYQKRNQ